MNTQYLPGIILLIVIAIVSFIYGVNQDEEDRGVYYIGSGLLLLKALAGFFID